jgi:hypothetical protein
MFSNIYRIDREQDRVGDLPGLLVCLEKRMASDAKWTPSAGFGRWRCQALIQASNRSRVEAIEDVDGPLQQTLNFVWIDSEGVSLSAGGLYCRKSGHLAQISLYQRTVKQQLIALLR